MRSWVYLLISLWLATSVHAATFGPPTSPLDTFDRANGALGANWGGPILDTDPNVMEIVTNRLDCTLAGNCSSYWSASTFGPDTEMALDLPTATAGSGLVILYVRLTSPNVASSTNGYQCRWVPGSTDTVELRRLTNSTSTVIAAATAVTVVDGDRLGCQMLGSQLCAWHQPGAGNWTQISCATDANHTGAGYTGVVVNSTAFALDNFWARTVTASGRRVVSPIIFP